MRGSLPHLRLNDANVLHTGKAFAILTSEDIKMSYISHKSEESMEDYLETILILQNEKGYVRSIDIANELQFTKASVSVAMKGLREKKLITTSPTGCIELTDEGLIKASKVLERHTLLTDWLIRLGVNKETASLDACRIEHDISEETFDALKNHCLKGV